MKKLLIAFSQEELSDSPLSFAAQLNNLEPVQVTAVFLPHIVLSNFWTMPGILADPVIVPIMEAPDPDVLERTRSHFEAHCIGEGLPFRIHEGTGYDGAVDIIKESRFADLMLVSGADYFDTINLDTAWDNLNRVMHDIECPLLVLPPQWDFPKTNIIAYDGSPSAVYALKLFAYLLPKLARNETLITYADEDPGHDIPDLSYLEELAAQHFPNLTLAHLSMDHRKDLPAWASARPASLLICGAMGRGFLSQTFHRSFAHQLIVDQTLPLFIAHR